MANMVPGALLELRRWLPALGANAKLMGWLAVEDAGRILTASLHPDGNRPHPLAGWVHT
ncbi:hypothetical protein [Streptomyces rimosus]